MLELAILGLLEDQELHGYEIRKRLRDELGLFSNISFGSLYPALSRLERGARDGPSRRTDGDVGGRPVPMTGSLSGERAALRSRRASPARGRRGRKVYRITDAVGSSSPTCSAARRGAGTDDARSFGLRLAFARYLPPRPDCACSSAAGPSWPSAWPRPRADGHRQPARPLRPVPRGAHHGVDRTRHLLARPADRRRAGRARRWHPAPQSEFAPRDEGDDRDGGRGSMSAVRVAIAGVGNCASSLVQGVEYYRDADPDDVVPGLMHVELGGYHVRDIEFVAAFDVDPPRSASTWARPSSPG
jgi:hypothetical protein